MRGLALALTAIALASIWVALTPSQAPPAHTPVVSFPAAGFTPIPSPDRKWVLVFECPNECSGERNLWLEDNRTHIRKLVSKYERNLGVSWALDSRHFFVNDAAGSDETSCSIYDPATLKATDVAALLTARDASLKRFLGAGHSYLEAQYWTNSRELLVVLYGHFDEPPAEAFSFTYRVSLNGNISRVLQDDDTRKVGFSESAPDEPVSGNPVYQELSNRLVVTAETNVVE